MVFCSVMTIPLRVIVDSQCTAAFNMAADLCLLNRAVEDNAVFLRFYGWNPPAISLGCLQDPEKTLDREALTARGIDWVQRPTGGRAILHWNDLTYAVAFPTTCAALGTTITQTYGIISGCLMAGLARIGIQCTSHDSASEYAATKRETKLPCFLSPNRNEIMVNGKKLVGSAQKRGGKAVLQHGSIPLDGNFRKLPEFCGITRQERDRQSKMLWEKCTCIGEIDPKITIALLIEHLTVGFADTLGFEIQEYSWEEDGYLAINDRKKNG
jgi:lipoyl(octanoyl) transferase